MTDTLADPLIEPFVERRRVPRLRSLLTGTIVFDDNKATFDCTVRSISAYGARVELPDAFRLPEEFNLVIPHHNQVHHANVVWRRGERAGLALSDAEDGALDRNRPTAREQRRIRKRAMAAANY